LQRGIESYHTEFTFQITELLLNLGSLLTILFNFLFEPLVSVLSPLFVHSFINSFIHCISFFIILVIGVFIEERATIAGKLIIVGIVQVLIVLFIIIFLPLGWCRVAVIRYIIGITGRTNIRSSRESSSSGYKMEFILVK